MAYNNSYQSAYPYYPQPQYYQQPVLQQPVQQTQQSQQQQIQNGGFIPVPSEDVARNYPVAPGNSVTFKNENAPYVYTKTMGFSQLDRPIFEKYKLVREEDSQEPEAPKQYDFNEDIESLKSEVEKLRSELDDLRGQISKPTTSKKKEIGGN